MKYIPLRKTGKFAIIDDSDFDYLSKFKWGLDPHGYAIRVVNKSKNNPENCKSILMHRDILKPEKGTPVDHINLNPLDNRRINLRICTYTQNQFNRPAPKNNTSGFKGVSLAKRESKWRVAITVNGKKYELGYFTDKIEAAKAYNEAAKKYHGEFAYLNKV